MDNDDMLDFVRRKTRSWVDARRVTINEFDRRFAEGAMTAYLAMEDFLVEQKAPRRGRPADPDVRELRERRRKKDEGMVADRRRKCGLPE